MLTAARCRLLSATASRWLAGMSTTAIGEGSVSAAMRSWTAPSYSTSAPAMLGAPFLGLNNLKDNPGAVKKKRRVGRGIGSSKGKTSGRGHKGQKARQGGSVPLWFEGGQTPLYKRLPKRGFKSRNPHELVAFNLGVLINYMEMGRLPGVGDSEQNPINMSHLVSAGILKRNTTHKRGGIKLLAKGKERLDRPVHLQVGRASAEAIAAVESQGGTVTTFHYNKLALRQLLRGPTKRMPQIKRQARPPPKYQAYYTDWSKRGFLHPEMQLRKWFQNNDPDLGEKFDQIREQQKKAELAIDEDQG